MTPKGLHDQLLEQMPEGAKHDSLGCAFCAMGSVTNNSGDRSGGGQVSKTYTEAEFQSAVDAAVAVTTAELAAKVQSLESASAESEKEVAVAAVKAEAAETIAALQAQLDAAVIEAQREKESREGLEAFLADAAAISEREAEIASRKEDRVAKVREAANFPDKYLEDNADRFAAMSDEDFEARLEEWRTLAGDSAGRIPSSTGLSATRETAASNTSTALVREVIGLRARGIDPRSL